MSSSKKSSGGSLGIFNQERYQGITLNDRGRTEAGHLSPATTDGLANHAEAVISFFHVPSESDVFFKAFITTFAESFQSDWNSERIEAHKEHCRLISAFESFSSVAILLCDLCTISLPCLLSGHVFQKDIISVIVLTFWIRTENIYYLSQFALY